MTDIKIPKVATAVIDALAQNGFEAYVVGGCVRDALLGREPNDWDVTTSARPDEIMGIFRGREGFHAIPTGIAHGTVTVVCEGTPVEVTTYRIDGKYSDSRHPDSVEFTSDIAADLSRRDFTVNAMAYSPTRGLVDVHGGARDLEAGVIRCVGKPSERFSEDALRIMRALRFASQLGFAIDEDTADAARELAPTLENIAKERITVELSKLLLGKSAASILRSHADVLACVLPMQDADKFTRAAERISRLAAVDLPLAITALLADAADGDVCEFFARLRFDNKTTKTTKDILTNKNARVDDKPSVKRLCRDVGVDTARAVLTLKRALGEDVREALVWLDEIVDGNECYSVAQLGIDGRELMALGHEPKTLGHVLDTLLEAVICGQVKNDKNELINAANRILKGNEK